METKLKKVEAFTQSITLKAVVIGFLSLLLLIPSVMIQNLIMERQNRSDDTIQKINAKWSNEQTLCGPVLSIPYMAAYKDKDEKTYYEQHTLHITPETLDIRAELFPEERHYGIYKTILYKSDIQINGSFEHIDFQKISPASVLWDKAYLTMSFSDLRGITNNLSIKFNGKDYIAEAGKNHTNLEKELVIYMSDMQEVSADQALSFSCHVNLNGSSGLHFIPIGKTTKVNVSGDWDAPGYTGNFSPEHHSTTTGFDASWSVLRFNRSIPDFWTDNKADYFSDSVFGVNLVNTVDHYQQNMRSAKYAIMFIVLTFVVFFFVEILTGKRIHPIQYLLVGIALILFYSLLLSISEQLNFGIAYLIASISTISLITIYAQSIFKNKTHTGVLAFMLCLLYIFLYVVLQLEDIALLIGSIGLFVILAVIMYFSRKVAWYKQEETDTTMLS